MRQVIVFNNKNVELPEPIEYNGLKFTSAGNTVFSIAKVNNYSPDIDMKYSVDNGKSWTALSYGTEISVNNGQQICFKGNNPTGLGQIGLGLGGTKFIISGSGTVNVSGNIMSLIDNEDGTTTNSAPPYKNTFIYLFDGCIKLIDASKLFLPVFVPSAAEYCYFHMFAGCTNLSSAPILPTTTLSPRCYYELFSGCTSLNKIVSYASNISASNCLRNWLNNTAATGDFYNLGGANYPSGASGIPSGWTVHTSL